MYLDAHAQHAHPKTARKSGTVPRFWPKPITEVSEVLVEVSEVLAEVSEVLAVVSEVTAVRVGAFRRFNRQGGGFRLNRHRNVIDQSRSMRWDKKQVFFITRTAVGRFAGLTDRGWVPDETDAGML